MELGGTKKQIIIGLAKEKNIKEIAAELDVNPKTIEWHWAQIKLKTGIKSHAGATHYAIANGWVDLMYDN